MEDERFVVAITRLVGEAAEPLELLRICFFTPNVRAPRIEPGGRGGSHRPPQLRDVQQLHQPNACTDRPLEEQGQLRGWRTGKMTLSEGVSTPMGEPMILFMFRGFR